MIDKVAIPSFTYLLRVWAERNLDQLVWRASLHPISSDQAACEPYTFASIDELLVFLSANSNQIQQIKKEEHV